MGDINNTHSFVNAWGITGAACAAIALKLYLKFEKLLLRHGTECPRPIHAVSADCG